MIADLLDKLYFKKMAGSWIIISCGIETSGFAALWTKTRSGKR
jgi:hypothetical protein